MVSNKEILKSKEISEKTMAHIERDSLTPTPETYELLYTYYAELDPQLARAIDSITEAGNTLTEKDCAELHLAHITDTKAEETFQKSEEMILTILSEVTNIIGEVGEATGSYDESLKKSNQELGNAKSIDDLKKVITDIASDNKKMMQKNKSLETELQESTNRMENLKEEVEAVRKEAKTDGLTGLINRKAFDETLRRNIDELSEENRTISLLMIDIDHFKKFNDTYGHQVGDQVLKLVARTLVEVIKGKDIAARYGGEEFSIILPETNLKGAVAVGNILREAVANKELVNKNTGDTLGRITISVGAAEALTNEPNDELIERADKGLYEAKEAGRDQVCAVPTGGQSIAA